VIADDPALTARLLRLVNSPIYGFPARIETVPQAISILGMTQVHDLALGTSFIQLFRDLPGELVDMGSFWRHSIACGVCARILAAQRRESNVERFFVAGLLHDIGRPIIFTHAAGEAREALTRARRSGELLYKVEHEIFGFHHGVVGSALLERWRLPGLLQEVTAWHHSPTLANRFPLETAVVHVADVIANALQMGSSGERLVPPLAPEAWEHLGIAPTALPTILKQVERQVNDAMTAVLGVA
jgi:HD-like signal output (HDOD) protein